LSAFYRTAGPARRFVDSADLPIFPPEQLTRTDEGIE
jgi:hypothetical protein